MPEKSESKAVSQMLKIDDIFRAEEVPGYVADEASFVTEVLKSLGVDDENGLETALTHLVRLIFKNLTAENFLQIWKQFFTEDSALVCGVQTLGACEFLK